MLFAARRNPRSSAPIRGLRSDRPSPGRASALLAQTDALGTLAWYQIGAANLVAAILMGTYLWRTHPALGRGLNFALEGGEQ